MWCGERDSKCEEMIRRIGKMDSAAGLTKWIILCLCLSRCAYACHILEEPRIYFLNAGDSVQNSNPGLKIYCHNATGRYLIHMWMTMTMHLNINSDSYIFNDGQTPDEIYQKYNQSLSLNVSDKQFQINPFKNECLGVYVDSPSESGYIITLIERNVCGLIMMVTGIILFWYAKILRQDSPFYNLCGIIFGIPAIILIWIDGKLTSQGKTKCVISAALMSYIVTEYREWLMCILVTLLIFRTIYDHHFGQGANVRMEEIIQLFVQQLVGLVLVYYSSNFLEISFSLCVGFILFPNAAFQRGNRFW